MKLHCLEWVLDLLQELNSFFDSNVQRLEMLILELQIFSFNNCVYALFLRSRGIKACSFNFFKVVILNLSLALNGGFACSS